MPKIPDGEFIPALDFSIDNLKRIVRNKKNTAPSPSTSSWKAFKHVSDSLFLHLSHMYKIIYNNKIRPSKLHYGNTILFEKPTKDIGLDKFRPITLLSVEYKLFSHVFNETLMKTLIKYKLIPISQNGFVPDRGSDQCIQSLINIIADAKHKNKELFCLFIDFAKAFDSVEH